MNKYLLAAALICMASAVQAGVENASGEGTTKSGACSSAKYHAKEFIDPLYFEITSYGKCDCSDSGANPTNGYSSRDRWTCNVDYRVEKVRYSQQQEQCNRQLHPMPPMDSNSDFVLQGVH